jgi:hypothetical protein
MNSSQNENVELEDNKDENKNEIENDNSMNDNDLDNESNETIKIYEWVDSFQLTKAKKNIARDFSDGLLLAEMIKKYAPKLVDLHNYPECSSKKQKLNNWDTLNNKVLKKLGLRLSKNEIEDVVNCKPNAIELLLKKVYTVIQKIFGNEHIREQVEKNNNNNFNNVVENIKKKIKDKDNVIKELNDAISVLENKLKSTLDYNQNLQNKINEVEEKIREKGFDI